MHLVFVITAYKLPEQLIRLVRRLNAPRTTFLIHIDRKTAPEIAREMRSGLKDEANVSFLDSHDCHWGAFGHVAASLKGLREIQRRALPCDYAILLTGQDYPLKSNAEIVATLSLAEGKSFLSHFPLPFSWWPGGGMDRIERWHRYHFGRYLVFPRNATDRHPRWLPRFVDAWFPQKRAFLPGLLPFGGSSYWCLSGEATRYVQSYLEAHPEFTRFFKSVRIPDEIFFQTLLLNSPLKDRIINDDQRHIDWSDPRPGRQPAILETHDLEALRASPKLFARKFDVTVDRHILDLLDASGR